MTNNITPSWKEEIEKLLYNLVQESVANAIKVDPDFTAVLKRRDDLRATALAAIVEATKSKVIGENEPEFNTPQPDLPGMSRNKLREEQLRRME